MRRSLGWVMQHFVHLLSCSSTIQHAWVSGVCSDSGGQLKFDEESLKARAPKNFWELRRIIWQSLTKGEFRMVYCYMVSVSALDCRMLAYVMVAAPHKRRSAVKQTLLSTSVKVSAGGVRLQSRRSIE